MRPKLYRNSNRFSNTKIIRINSMFEGGNRWCRNHNQGMSSIYSQRDLQKKTVTGRKRMTLSEYKYTLTAENKTVEQGNTLR